MIPRLGSVETMRAHPVFADMPVTIFETMSGLAREHGAINLGQGFPDDQGPEELRRLAADALMTGSNQYAPSRGLPSCATPSSNTTAGSRASP